MELDHDIDFVANGLADLLEGFERRLQIGRRDILTLGLFRRLVEWPDLHRRDAFGKQRFRQFVGAVQEAVQVIIVLAGRKPVIGRRLPRRLLDIFGARAGIVGADFLARKTAEQLRDRLASHFAENVPERDVEGGIAAHFRTRRTEADIAHQFLRQKIDRQRIAADDTRDDIFVDIAFHRFGPEKGLPQSGNALIGVDQNPEQVAPLGDTHRLQLGDLHVSSQNFPRACISRGIAVISKAVCGR
ncbi:hypothetical protein D3C71_1444900 [compost metagenome]